MNQHMVIPCTNECRGWREKDGLILPIWYTIKQLPPSLIRSPRKRVKKDVIETPTKRAKTSIESEAREETNERIESEEMEISEEREDDFGRQVVV